MLGSAAPVSTSTKARVMESVCTKRALKPREISKGGMVERVCFIIAQREDVGVYGVANIVPPVDVAQSLRLECL